MKSRIIAGVLATTMAISSIPMSALAAVSTTKATPIATEASNLSQPDGNTLRM